VDDGGAAGRAEGHLDRVGELVDAALERLPRCVVELEGLGHVVSSFLRSVVVRRDADDDAPGARAPTGAGGTRGVVRSAPRSLAR
jgi:hypothetical protein